MTIPACQVQNGFPRGQRREEPHMGREQWRGTQYPDCFPVMRSMFTLIRMSARTSRSLISFSFLLMLVQPRLCSSSFPGPSFPWLKPYPDNPIIPCRSLGCKALDLHDFCREMLL